MSKSSKKKFWLQEMPFQEQLRIFILTIRKYVHNHKNRLMLTTNAEKMVATDAPIKPSQVFLGDNLINGVLPKKKPKI